MSKSRKSVASGKEQAKQQQHSPSGATGSADDQATQSQAHQTNATTTTTTQGAQNGQPQKLQSQSQSQPQVAAVTGGKTGEEQTEGDKFKKFEGEGVVCKAKLVGTELVMEPRGDKMCQNSIQRLKAIIKGQKSHKRRIIMKISYNGVKIYDEKTNEILHHHEVKQISFIASDDTDTRTFGYVCDVPSKAHQFICFKTSGPAIQVMSVISSLFEAVLVKKKEEGAAAAAAATTTPTAAAASLPAPPTGGGELAADAAEKSAQATPPSGPKLTKVSSLIGSLLDDDDDFDFVSGGGGDYDPQQQQQQQRGRGQASASGDSNNNNTSNLSNSSGHFSHASSMSGASRGQQQVRGANFATSSSLSQLSELAFDLTGPFEPTAAQAGGVSHFTGPRLPSDTLLSAQAGASSPIETPPTPMSAGQQQQQPVFSPLLASPTQPPSTQQQYQFQFPAHHNHRQQASLPKPVPVRASNAQIGLCGGGGGGLINPNRPPATNALSSNNSSNNNGDKYAVFYNIDELPSILESTTSLNSANSGSQTTGLAGGPLPQAMPQIGSLKIGNSSSFSKFQPSMVSSMHQRLGSSAGALSRQTNPFDDDFFA